MSSPTAAPLSDDPPANEDRGEGGFAGTIVFGTGRGAGVKGGNGDAHEVDGFVLSGSQTEGEVVGDGGALCTGGNVVTPCATAAGADNKAAATKAKPKRPTKRISTSHRRISLERCGKQ